MLKGCKVLIFIQHAHDKLIKMTDRKIALGEVNCRLPNTIETDQNNKSWDLLKRFVIFFE